MKKLLIIPFILFITIVPIFAEGQVLRKKSVKETRTERRKGERKTFKVKPIKK